jgi:hypothetical protein
VGCWIGQFRMRKGRRRKEWRLNSPTVVKKVSLYQEDINHFYIYVHNTPSSDNAPCCVFF